jgi:outer membrane protein assembly factor BamE (lipoprotein component of BamABCDE complex)
VKPALVMLAAATVLAGCATGGRIEENGPGVAARAAPQAALAAAQAARDKVHVGDTRDQVAAALGPSNILAFESGWQVWIYRWPGADNSTRAATELVILVDPNGTVRKTRVRRGQDTASHP